jgi:hypothetical protein
VRLERAFRLANEGKSSIEPLIVDVDDASKLLVQLVICQKARSPLDAGNKQCEFPILKKGLTSNHGMEAG